MSDFKDKRLSKSGQTICEMMKADPNTKSIGLLDICPGWDFINSCKADEVLRSPYGPTELRQKV